MYDDLLFGIESAGRDWISRVDIGGYTWILEYDSEIHKQSGQSIKKSACRP